MDQERGSNRRGFVKGNSDGKSSQPQAYPADTRCLFVFGLAKVAGYSRAGRYHTVRNNSIRVLYLPAASEYCIFYQHRIYRTQTVQSFASSSRPREVSFVTSLLPTDGHLANMSPVACDISRGIIVF